MAESSSGSVRKTTSAMDEVARRAGTNKNALYRRQPNRVALGVVVYRRLAATGTVLPDTGAMPPTHGSGE